MHALLEGLKWLGVFFGWGVAVWMCWTLVRVGSGPRDQEPTELEPARAAVPVPARRQGAKVIPIRQ